MHRVDMLTKLQQRTKLLRIPSCSTQQGAIHANNQPNKLTCSTWRLYASKRLAPWQRRGSGRDTLGNIKPAGDSRWNTKCLNKT
jgi:hypothetical protein